jgi:hypothetical protein
MEIKVRTVEGDVKSTQELERELVEKHERETAIDKDGPSKVDATPEGQDSPKKEESKKEEEVVELDEAQVLGFLKDKYGYEGEGLAPLLTKEEKEDVLPEDVAAFLKYKKDTGRGLADFYRANQDYDEMPEESLVRQYLKEQNEGLDDDDIQMLYEDSFLYNEEEDTPQDVRSRKLAFKKTLADAKKFFESQKEKYKAPLESRDQPTPLEADEEYKAYREALAEAETQREEAKKRSDYFRGKMEELFNEDFKGFEFQLDGDKSFVYKPDEGEKLLETHTSPMNFVQKFLDDKGLIKDSVGYHRALAAAMDPVKMAKFFYDQGKSDMATELSKDTKNLDLEARRSPQSLSVNKGVKALSTEARPNNGLRVRGPKTN